MQVFFPKLNGTKDNAYCSLDWTQFKDDQWNVYSVNLNTVYQPNLLFKWGQI